MLAGQLSEKAFEQKCFLKYHAIEQTEMAILHFNYYNTCSKMRGHILHKMYNNAGDTLLYMLG